ncbi:MAG: M28 family peptidase [Gemmataceae bacterium]
MKTRFLLASLAVWGLFVPIARSAEPASDVVTRMKNDLFYLAGPECNGRGVGSKGIDKAADYIAGKFKEFGLKPAMKNGSYFQPFTIAGPTVVSGASLEFLGPKAQKLILKPNVEFRPIGLTASGELAGGVVFAGYGISLNSDQRKYDDYKDLDVTGKLVVLLRKTPRAGQKNDPFDPKEDPEYASLAAKVKLAASKGAAAVAFVNDSTLAKEGDDLQDFRYAGVQSAAKIPVIHMSRSTLDHLLVDATGKTLVSVETTIDKDLKPMSAILNGWTANANVSIKKNDFACKNIVGVLEGSGPLADETVVVGAHYDHLGTSSYGSLEGPSAEGKVHWGADDNGSGTTGVIEMARRISAMKDRQGRRIVFILFSGEERGLFGSIHYCKEPLFPLDKTVFMLNFDMIGRVKPVEDGNGGMKDRLLVYGTGTGEGFDKLADQMNTKFKIVKFGAGTGPSDHDSFYRKHVPVFFFFTGTHREYHRPADVPELINVPGMKDVVDYGEKILLHFAALPERPKYLVTRERFVDPDEKSSHGAAPQSGSARMSGPTLGVMPSYEEGTSGMKLDGVSPGGPAEKAGLKDGDIIVEINGKAVTNVTNYMTVMNQQKPGVEIEVVILRKGTKTTLKVTPMTKK